MSERGVIHLRAGRPTDALACQQKALDGSPDDGDPVTEPLLHNNLSDTLCTIGELASALNHGRIALRIAEKAHYPYEQARAHARIGAALAPDDPETALAHWERALAMHTEMGTPERHEAAEKIRKLARRTGPRPTA